MSDEAHLSAEQSGSRTASRVSQPDVDRRWTRGNPRPPRPRPQKAVGLITLKKRSDFLAANAGRRYSTPGFLLLVKDRADGLPDKRIGYTVTKKIGNAVVRNRIKRRFREMARAVLDQQGRAGADHIMIGRGAALTRSHDQLMQDFAQALAKAGQA